MEAGAACNSGDGKSSQYRFKDGTSIALVNVQIFVP
jgi:hypothetical protein